ncbi:uncharacterized protein LOC123554965 [Mercenaria mercenaria]|uniref:uncharacterized protein LOC123554965 n=1 Tax=Mercenaria mercenaria TaxID=6596 RepID=UPI00234F0837|nr:uncharacterized protein LOC123554965 [Mercenaria mercenaria]
MAQSDPNGVLCKVCLSCFEDRGLSLGCTSRSQTEVFKQLRKQTKEDMMDIVYGYAVESRRVSVQPTFWKEQFTVDILKECQRLLEGFKSSMSGSGTINTMHEIKDQVSVPHWQKSTFWTLESHTTRCRHCGGKLGHRKKMRNCRVCGLALCKTCSQREVLLYYKDGTRQLKTADAHISIIRFVGCPDKEPQCSMLLYCCKDCKEEIIRRQIEDDTWYLEKSKPPDLETEIIQMDAKFRPLVEDIRDDMEKLLPVLDVQGGIRDSIDIDVLIEAEQKMQEMSIEEIECLTLKSRVQERLKIYWNLYSELRSVIKRHSDKLTGDMFEFVMNYATARKEFYIETESKILKISTG